MQHQFLFHWLSSSFLPSFLLMTKSKTCTECVCNDPLAFTHCYYVLDQLVCQPDVPNECHLDLLLLIWGQQKFPVLNLCRKPVGPSGTEMKILNSFGVIWRHSRSFFQKFLHILMKHQETMFDEKIFISRTSKIFTFQWWTPTDSK